MSPVWSGCQLYQRIGKLIGLHTGGGLDSASERPTKLASYAGDAAVVCGQLGRQRLSSQLTLCSCSATELLRVLERQLQRPMSSTDTATHSPESQLQRTV